MTTTLAIHSEAPHKSLIKPEPRCGRINIRPAVLDGERSADFMFIDDLQKKHGRMVGFMARDWFPKNHVLIAEAEESRTRLGYIVFKDKYMKREELGIIHQINVVPGEHRGLVGASLVKAAFEHCPWGVRLFCCWVAQDLEANHFWESIGFVPIAFRTGARGKANGGRRPEDRLQIFWQRRIREGDDDSPYWYPSETSGGGVKENRIVLPIPPGTHWSDAKPTVLPGPPTMENVNAAGPALPEGDGQKPKRSRKPKVKAAMGAGGPAKPSSISMGGLRFAPGKKPAPAPEAKPEKPKRERQKNDPKLVAAAREFRDRYLDEVNSGRFLPEGNGKYDVSRQLEAGGPPAAMKVAPAVPLLNAA